MDTFNIFKRTALATLIAASLTGLAGCEWDNSDEWESNASAETPSSGTPTNNGGSDSDSEAGDGDGDGDGDNNDDGAAQGVVISGTLTTASPTEGSTLCLDSNNNQQCDDGELSTAPDEVGTWEITLGEGDQIAEDTQVIFVPEAKTPTLTGTVQPNPAGGNVADVRVSMISTLFERERQRLEDLGVSDPEGEAYIRIAEELGITPEQLEAYLNPDNPNGYTISPSERERLERIDDLTAELAVKVDEAIPPGEKANLTPEEINDLINDQVADNLPVVVDEVNKSQVTHPEDEDFQEALDNLDSNPVFKDAVTPPDTTKASGEAQLEQRIEQAMTAEPDSNYFQESGFERLPILGANSVTYDIELLPTGNTLSGTPVVYYEARQRIAEGTENGETAITNLNIVIPKQNDLGDLQPVALDDEYWWSYYFNSGDYCDVPACDDLRVRPQIISAHTWNIQSFQAATLKLGHSDQIYMTAVNNDGTIIASNRNTGFSSEMILRPFNLNALPIRTVTKELYNIDLPSKAEAGIEDPNIPETLEFDSGSAAVDQTIAYAFTERTFAETLMTNWGPGGTRDNNTNRVYGESGAAARTFGDLMYATRTPYAGPNPTLPDSVITNAIQLAGPTGEVYTARLIGQPTADEGTIAIDRFNAATLQWEPIKPLGTWAKTALPFPRINLDLPGGFRYTQANPGLRLGEAYLYEYTDGFVHHGWLIPSETDVAKLVGRRKVDYVLSNGAFTQLTEGLEALGLLQRHPSDFPEPDEDIGGY